MNDHRAAKSRVVDLLRFKAERAQQTLDFETHAQPAPRIGTVEAFRPLTPQQIAHRQRMQAFLSRR
jgi:hypothetical protein